jgi:hypothetical protein
MRFLIAVLVAKTIESTIGRSEINQIVPGLTATPDLLEKIPGLGPLIEKITDSISGEQERSYYHSNVLPVSKFMC